MKRLFLLMLLSTLIVNAQGQVKFGIKGAYNIPMWSWSSGEEIEVTSSGFTLGGIVDYGVSKKFSIRGELNYSNYAFKLSDKTSFETNFMEVPVMLRACIANKLHTYFGLGVGLKMSDQAYWSLDDPAADKLPVLLDYKSSYLASTKVFVPVGIAYDFGKFYLDVRHELSIKDMSNDNVEFVKGIGGFSIGVGFLL